MQHTLSPRPGRSGEPGMGEISNQRLFVLPLPSFTAAGGPGEANSQCQSIRTASRRSGAAYGRRGVCVRGGFGRGGSHGSLATSRRPRPWCRALSADPAIPTSSLQWAAGDRVSQSEGQRAVVGFFFLAGAAGEVLLGRAGSVVVHEAGNGHKLSQQPMMAGSAAGFQNFGGATRTTHSRPSPSSRGTHGQTAWLAGRQVRLWTTPASDVQVFSAQECMDRYLCTYTPSSGV